MDLSLSPRPFQTLEEYQNFLWWTRDLRRLLVRNRIEDGEPGALREALRRAADLLDAMPRNRGAISLKASPEEEETLRVDPSYESEELKRDLLYFENGYDALREYMESLHENFTQNVESLVQYLHEKSGSSRGFRYFITDRDGTINNYCGRYNSSIQSGYNAHLLYSFARRTTRTLVLTSAPLRGTGVTDLSTLPDGSVVYAGSKGREFLNDGGERIALPLTPREREMMEELNRTLSELCREEPYRKFSLIGSGLQFKFGQSTVARQDIFHSVPEGESADFLRRVERLVKDLDPEERYFRIEDTGKDVEILLTVKQERGESEVLKDFDKGDGLRFLRRSLPLEEGGAHLVAGDTRADLPMIAASREFGVSTASLFVTEDEALIRTLAGEGGLAVPRVDMLVFALERFARDLPSL